MFFGMLRFTSAATTPRTWGIVPRSLYLRSSCVATSLVTGMTDLQQTVLITGACGDIGRSLAREFAGRGAHLALCDVEDGDMAAQWIRPLIEKGTKALYRQADVTDASAVEAFVTTAVAELGAIDVCICNAGIVERGLLIDLPPEAWRRTLDVNLTGCFITAQAAARVMMKPGRGGHIVMMSSWVQDIPRSSIGAYCVSKSGLKMLSKCLALELGPHGIRVNAVAPGFVDAGLTGRNLSQNPGRRSDLEAEIPLGRLISADELAQAVRMLCSDDASYITGANLLIDGGSSLCFRKAQS